MSNCLETLNYHTLHPSKQVKRLISLLPNLTVVTSHRAVTLDSKRQKGLVLIVSLILMLILTLIGVTGMQTTLLEEKMAGNSRDQNLGFQSAESTLRTAEAQIETLWNAGNGSIQMFCNGTAGLFSTVPGCVNPAPDPADPLTWTDNTKSLVANKGRYFITYVGAYNAAPPTPVMFMITAKGAGAQANTQVLLRSYYGGDTKWLPNFIAAPS